MKGERRGDTRHVKVRHVASLRKLTHTQAAAGFRPEVPHLAARVAELDAGAHLVAEERVSNDELYAVATPVSRPSRRLVPTRRGRPGALLIVGGLCGGLCGAVLRSLVVGHLALADLGTGCVLVPFASATG